MVIAMGEYAKRKSDGKEVWIGCCEDLSNIRYEQCKDVIYDHFTDNVDYYRIPTPDEDGIQPGEFHDLDGIIFENGVPCMLWLNTELEGNDEIWNELRESKGEISFMNRIAGLSVSVPCQHNLGLPTGEGARFWWCGKNNVLYLSAMHPCDKEMKICVRCAVCGKMWSTTFDKLEPVIYYLWMKLRLLHQCTDYWYERNDTPCDYQVTSQTQDGSPMTIYPLRKDKWCITVNEDTAFVGGWDECRNWFIYNLPQWKGEGPITVDNPLRQLYAERTYMMERYDEESRKNREAQIARFMEGDFDVTITEKLERTVRVHAANQQEAENMVEGQYGKSEIVLTDNDFKGHEISSKKCKKS